MNLHDIVQRAGWISITRGVACLYPTWKHGDDIHHAIECFRRHQPWMFHPHRRGLK